MASSDERERAEREAIERLKEAEPGIRRGEIAKRLGLPRDVVDKRLAQLKNGHGDRPKRSTVVCNGAMHTAREKRRPAKAGEAELVLSIAEAERQLAAARKLYEQRVADRICYGLREMDLARAEERYKRALEMERRAG